MSVFGRDSFTIPELAIMLGLHRNTVLKRVRKGYILAVLVNGKSKYRKHYRIPSQWVLDTYECCWHEMYTKLANAQGCSL